MKLMNVTNFDKLFETVNACEGDVILKTKTGDRLNLKSQLTKIFTLATIFKKSQIDEMDLELTNKKDVAKLLRFSMQCA